MKIYSTTEDKKMKPLCDLGKNKVYNVTLSDLYDVPCEFCFLPDLWLLFNYLFLN